MLVTRTLQILGKIILDNKKGIIMNLHTLLVYSLMLL